MSLFVLGLLPFLVPEDPYQKIVCGDHWFTATLSLNLKSNQAFVGFDGDSKPETRRRRAIYEIVGDVINIGFTDGAGGGIQVFQGTGIHAVSNESEFQSISPCHIR